MNQKDVKLYDRSIRTWGFEAQQLLLNAHILSIGYDSLMSEILKNVVISGVSKVTILDTFKNKQIQTTENDRNHLFTPEMNNNRISLIDKVKSVNVDLQIDVISNEQLSVEYLNQFTMIIISLPEYQLFELLEKVSIPILCCFSVGCVGNYYVKNVNNHNESLMNCIKSNQPSLLSRSLVQKYVEKYNEMNDYNMNDLYEQLKQSLNEQEQILVSIGLNYAPVNSVVGSIASQEIINIIGRRETYTNDKCNGFIYDCLNNYGDIIATYEKEKKMEEEKVETIRILELD